MTFTIETSHGPFRVSVAHHGVVYRVNAPDPATHGHRLTGAFMVYPKGTPGRSRHFWGNLSAKAERMARIAAGERHLLEPSA